MMSGYSSIPDLISSSVSLDMTSKVPCFQSERKTNFTSGTIYPFTPAPSVLQVLKREITSVLQIPEAKKICLFLIFNIISSIVLLLWCHSTNSMALTAYTYLTLFDIFSILTCLLSLWVQLQRPTPAFSFGYERFEVLAVFASTMLAQLGSFFILKESIEALLQQPEIHTGRLLIGTVFACFVHLIVTFGVNNRAMNHIAAASSSSWLQEHVADMSERQNDRTDLLVKNQMSGGAELLTMILYSCTAVVMELIILSFCLCNIIPGLHKLLLPRVNPFLLIAVTGGVSLFITYILIDTKLYYSADTWAAVGIAIMMFGTMAPMSVYTAKILLQTTPSHILGQLDKVLREASTLDGVLEFRQEHFWTLSFGSLAGSVQVRVRRDADEQLVLAHVYSRLSNIVSLLTIQIFKDDWTRATGYSMMSSPSFMPITQPHRSQSPNQDGVSSLPKLGYNPFPPLNQSDPIDINRILLNQAPPSGRITLNPSTHYPS